MRNDVHEEKLTKAQREQLVLDAQFKRERAETIGRIIIFTIAIANIVFSVIDLVLGGSGFFSLILSIVFSIALIFGQNWARILFVIGLGLSVFVSFYVLFSAGFSIMFLVILAYSIAATILLFSKPVQEYMYWAKNG